jgi:Leucine-rich repeat (LRR) protein
VPEEVLELSNLRTLEIMYNHLQTLPPELGNKLGRLKVCLSLPSHLLPSATSPLLLGSVFAHLVRVCSPHQRGIATQNLDVSHNKLTKLPPSIAKYAPRLMRVRV